ncbi:MAG: AraC family transcriptional regulator, partial [Spirochaetales bacterium]|nr:AraC family transcriptional regulator [Spirochaetales bacterium]
MEETYKREGFFGEKLIVIPSELFAPHATHPLAGRLFPTDAGFFPEASHHYRKRTKGCDEFIVLYCIDGNGTIVIPKKTISLRQGEVFCIPRHMPHTYYADEKHPWSILWLHFKGTDADFYPVKNCEKIMMDHPKEQERLQQLFDLLFDALEGSFTVGNFIHISQITSSILSEIYYKEKFHDEDVRNHAFTKAVRFMHAHIDSSLGLEEITNYLMVSKSYLHQLFRTYTDHAPMAYFNMLKIQKACRYLSMTDLQIQEVALKVGFSDMCYFSRRFKQLMKVSPRDYRNGSV